MKVKIREKILAGIYNLNTWAFTVLAILFAVILTTLLNSFFAHLSGSPINPRIFMFATIDAILIPLIIAPILLNMVKRVTNLEQTNQQLTDQVAEQQYAHHEAESRIASLQAINDLAIACAAATPEDNLYVLIANKLRAITGALAVGISEYDPEEQVLITRHVNVSEKKTLSIMNKILGQNIIGLRSPVSSEMLQKISNDVIGEVLDIHEVTFGAIPKPVSDLIQKTFNIGNFTGLAFLYNGELWGTAVVAFKKGQTYVDKNIILTFANVAALAIRRQKIEKALLESEMRYRILVEMSPEAITMADLSGNILYCNQQTALVHGYESVDQILGTNILSYFAPDEHANVLERIQTVPEINQMDDTQFLMVKQDGSHFMGEIRACTVPGIDGKPIGMLGITRDITNRKKAEAERERFIHELKSKNDELEQFSYIVSHDLKSPLITVSGFLSYLDDDVQANDASKIKRDIELIKQAINKMDRLLNELLKLSRLGRKINPPEEIKFEELVHEALENVHGRLKEGDIQIKLHPNLSVVYGDRQRLTEVLQNLLDNAAKFMGEQITPEIEVGQIGEENGKPVFYVKDNGIGIKPDHHQRIFGLFERLNPKTEGTGIGLAIVKKIIEYHGGRIWVESQAGKGTTFYFTLPVQLKLQDE